MECHDQMGQKVLPVFYYVNPSDVRRQKRDFATAFAQQEDEFKGEMDKVNKWKKALTTAANLSGFPISKTLKEGESAIITKIVKEILGGIPPHGIEKNLIGIESRTDELNECLDMDATKEVRIVGICGMGGIGKTTIAQALFRRISYRFEGSCFLKDVRENSSSKRDICALQEKMITDLVAHRWFMIQDLIPHHWLMNQDPEYRSTDMIRERVCNKKVLLVLDDVDDMKQLEFLAASHDWFGAGSRIIIPTRDEHLLSYADVKYKPDFLLMDQALELFSLNAFKQTRPPEGFEELSNLAVYYTSCLPLALKVLGSFFHGRQAHVWKSALDRLAKTPDRKIFETLKLSYDGLEDSEKEIFLDIACFFKGKDEEHVTRVLDSFGFDAVMGISVLVEKSLITVSNKRIDMHDQIQEMGWKIVRDDFRNSRLWQPEEIHDVIKNNTNLEAIKAIMLPGKEYHIHQHKETMGFSADVFERMNYLRLLDIDFRFTSQEPTVLPDELRWFCWNKYPFFFLPLADMSKLYGLEMAKGNIKYLWKGRKILPNLNFIHLDSLHSLTRFPDVSGAPYIQKLVVSSCKQLQEVDESLGFLKRLVYLDMSSCHKLKCLLSKIEMESLETLILTNCLRLEKLPEVSPCMVKLSHISLNGCSKLELLPSSIRYLKGLSFLNLNHCKSLKIIPNAICELKCLKRLYFDECRKLQNLPEGFGSMVNLEELRLGSDGYNIDEIMTLQRTFKSTDFHTLASLSSLKKLDLSGRQIGVESFPSDHHAFSLLEEFNLSGNSKLIQLPAIICHLSRLKHLELNNCHRLQTLCALPSSIQILKANKCSSLEKIGDLSKECEWLYKIWFISCIKLQENQESQRYLDNLLQKSFLEKCAAVNHRLTITIPGRKIPSWFRKHKHGCEIALKLTPQWHTEIMGFVVCGVFSVKKWFSRYDYPHIIFKIVNDGKVILKSEVGDFNVTETSENGNVWMSYMPLGFFQHMYRDLQPEDWSRMEGNLVMTLKLTDSYQEPVGCGVHVVYKEDVKAVEKNRIFVSDYGNLVHAHHKYVRYDEIISGNTYVYEERSSDYKMMLPSGSRTSRRLVSNVIRTASYALPPVDREHIDKDYEGNDLLD